MKLKIFPVGTLGTNCYFIVDEQTNAAAVVDPGWGADHIYGKLIKLGLKCEMILLTHGHADHTGALGELRRKTGAPVYIHTGDAKMLVDPALSQARYLGAPVEVLAQPEHLISDGDKIALRGTTIEVMHTPGHTPGSVCYILRDDGIILSGDTLFRESVGRYDLAGGDYKELMRSLEKLASLEGDWRVYPGHGRSTTLSHEREHNMYLNG